MNLTPVRNRRPLVLAAGLLAAAATAIVLLLGGGGSTSPSSALAQAAQNTAQVTSGVATARIEVAGGQTVETVVRFDGENLEVAFDEPTADGGTRRHVIRAVDGQGFERVGDAGWTALEGGDEGDLADRLRAEIADRALVDAVRTAPGLSQQGDVYRAHLTGEQLAGLRNSLLGLGDAPLAEGADVEVTAGADGLVRAIRIVGATTTRTVTYAQLGEPQSIEAPPVG